MDTVADRRMLLNDGGARTPEKSQVSGTPATHSMPSYRWPGHPTYETVQAEPQSEYPRLDTFETENAEQHWTLTNAQLSWRPFYLRRSVIAIFMGTFAIIIAAIEVLLAVSNKTDGLATSYPELHYLWTYGPTTILTLLSALWARAEYQSKLVAPWIRLMEPSVDSRRTLLLDYVSDFQLFVVFKALRNKDWTVSITSAVSVIIKLLIVISTGLITLSWTGVHLDSHPMVLQDTFSNDNNRLSKTGTLSYYIMKGLIEQNLTYPDGISKDFAYQSVLTNLPGPAETRFTVDGFSNSLDCVPASLNLTGFHAQSFDDANISMNLTVASSDCNVNVPRTDGPVFSDPQSNSSVNGFFSRFAETRCDGTSGDDGNRVLVMFGNITYTRDFSRNITGYKGVQTHPIVATLQKSEQMLCVPTYTISRVEVARNGTQTQSVTLVTGSANRTLDSIHPWALMSAQYKAYDDVMMLDLSRRAYISTVPVNTDLYMGVAINNYFGSNTTTTAQATDMFDPVLLKQVAERYYRQHAAIIAKQSLMEAVTIDTTGTAIFMANRLVVRMWAAQWMAGLAAACLLLSSIALFLVPQQGILPRNPSNIPDMASLLQHSHHLQETLRDLSATDEKALARGLGGRNFQSWVIQNPTTNQDEFVILDRQTQHADDAPQAGLSQVKARRNYHPVTLHPAFRLIFCFILLGMITALELLLHKSNREDGLGDVSDDTYMHYLWTALPALILGMVAMAFSSMDFQIRSLAPYTMLNKTVTTDVLMVLDYLDMSVPRTMYKELRFGNIGAFATTTMFLVASLFTIFSGSLFQALTIPRTGSISLRANQSFVIEPDSYNNKAASIASLILQSNLSYSNFTYENLAFPQFLPDVSTDSTNATSSPSMTVSIEAVVPAVRARMDCRLYDSSKHHMNLTLNETVQPSGGLAKYYNPLWVWIEGEECVFANNTREYAGNLLFSTFPNTTYFGINPAATGFLLNGCSDLLYTWGKIDYAAEPIVQHIASLGCNTTFEAVDTVTTFAGTGLQMEISTEKPPQPREDTAHNSTMHTPSLLVNLYQALADIDTDPQSLSTFFSYLVSSRFAVPISDLGDASANDKIAAAIRRQHGIIQAQHLAQQRVPAATSNVTLASIAFPADNDAQPVYVGNLTDTSGPRRVVQDAVSTRILEALLGACLVLLLVGWLFVRRTDVLPRSPTSIASVAALVAGGNVLDRLPPDAEWQSRADLAAVLRGGGETKFWIGWGVVPGREAGDESEGGGVGRFGIFALGDGVTMVEDAEGHIMERKRKLREQVTAYHGAADSYDYLEQEQDLTHYGAGDSPGAVVRAYRNTEDISSSGEDIARANYGTPQFRI